VIHNVSTTDNFFASTIVYVSLPFLGLSNMKGRIMLFEIKTVVQAKEGRMFDFDATLPFMALQFLLGSSVECDFLQATD